MINRPSRIPVSSWLPVFAATFLLAAIFGAARANFAQEYQITRDFAGRTGPGENYPVAEELTASTRASKVTEEPNGWVALRLDDGRIVWVTEEDFRTNAALLASTPPLRPSLGTDSGIAETNGQRPVQAGGPLPSTGGGQILQTGGNLVAPQRALDTNWRPVGAAGAKASVSVPTASGASVPPQSLPSGITDRRPSPVAQDPDEVLDQVELELSTILTKDPTQWRFDSIQDKLASLAASRLTASQIARMDALARKLVTARQIAELSLKANVPSQSIPGSIVLPYSAAGHPPTSPAWYPTSGLGTSSAGAFSSAISTVVPPPSTRIMPESRTLALRNNTPALATSQLPAIPAPIPGATGETDTTAVYPASFDSPFTAELPKSVGAPGPAEIPQESVPGSMRPASSVSLREEIARELNDLRRERFDAVGRLVKAQVRRPSDPPYMVVNESGAIVCYVKPAPGALLRTYVGHWVGINGRKARLPDGRGLLITAESLRLLDPPERGIVQK